MKTISSLNNETVKLITGLSQKSSLRKKSDVFTVEGKRELELAHKGGFTIHTVFCCPDVFKFTSLEKWCADNLGTMNIILVTENVYEKISYRKKNRGNHCISKKENF